MLCTVKYTTHPAEVLIQMTIMKAKLNLEWEVVLSLQATKRVSDAKLAKDFQAVLVEFQNAQKIAQDREKFYIPFVAQAVLPTR